MDCNSILLTFNSLVLVGPRVGGFREILSIFQMSGLEVSETNQEQVKTSLVRRRADTLNSQDQQTILDWFKLFPVSTEQDTSDFKSHILRDWFLSKLNAACGGRWCSKPGCYHRDAEHKSGAFTLLSNPGWTLLTQSSTSSDRAALNEQPMNALSPVSIKAVVHRAARWTVNEQLSGARMVWHLLRANCRA